MQEDSVVKVLNTPPNNLLLRASYDNVHAPYCLRGIGVGAYALSVRRVAAEQGRQLT
jgi:hypothetical protein